MIYVGGCGGGGGIGPDGDDPDLLFEETFTNAANGQIPVGWTIILQEDATEEGPPDWRVRAGRLRQSSNVRAPDTAGLSYAINYEGTLAVVGDTTWTNISFKVDIIPRDDDGVGVIFRWKPSDTDPDGNFYRLLMVEDSASGGPKLRLDRRNDGVWHILDEKTTGYNGYNEDYRYTVEVDMVVDNFSIKLNNTIVFEFQDRVADGGLPHGMVGLFCYGEEGVDFDNVQVFRRGP